MQNAGVWPAAQMAEGMEKAAPPRESIQGPLPQPASRGRALLTRAGPEIWGRVADGWSCGFPDWGSMHAVWVVDTDYEDYALLHSSGTTALGQDTHMAFLYSTCPSPHPGPIGAPWRGEQSTDLPCFSFPPQAVPRPPDPK